MKHLPRLSSFAYALVVSLLAALAAGHADAAHERFESPEVSWRLAESDGSARLMLHERDFTVAHSGRGSEHARVFSTQGTFVYLAHPVAPARIIDELEPSLWLKADRAGLRFMLRVVLPRAKDRDGKTLTVLLEGDFYTQVGAWQRLSVRGLRKLLEAHVRIRRLQLGDVDPREAYIDHAVLNAYSEAGITELWIDDLEFDGFASSGSTTTPVTMMRTPAASGQRTDSPNTSNQLVRATGSTELQGSVLLVEGRPQFVRGIEYNGESLSWLKDVGFNTVLLRSPPNTALLAEAENAGVWLVAPPVFHNGILEVTPAHRRVIAWRLGAGATAADVSDIETLVVQIRRHDRDAARPIVCDLRRDVGHFARIGDIFLIGKPILGTGFELSRYGDWVRGQARPVGGKPLWGFVQTEPSMRLVEQLGIAFANAAPSTSLRLQLPKLSATTDQMRLLAFETIAAGARGVCFRSRSRLDLDDDVAKLRTASLRLINSELSLATPWVAGGAVAEEVSIRGKDARGQVLKTGRSRLLVITRHANADQYVPQPLTEQSVSFAVHSVPITDQAYHLAPNGLQPLLQSQASGPRVTIQDASRVSLVLFTQDPLAINRSTRLLANQREQRATWLHEIADLELHHALEVVGRIRADDDTRQQLERARSMLDRSQQLLRSSDLGNSIATTLAAQQSVHRVQREIWDEAVLAFSSPMSSLLCTSFATLPLHHEARNRLGTASWNNNRLKAGDCESLEEMLAAGWRQQVTDQMAKQTHVELSAHNPAGGRSALRLVSRNPSGASTNSQPSPLTIKSAPIVLAAGQSVRVHGWVKVTPAADAGSDGLMIVDSFAGEDFAERVAESSGWREFTLYRIAPRSGELFVSFVLTGAGEAWIDEVSATVLQ